MPFAPSPDDLALLRAWVRGVPLAALPYPITNHTLKRLADLRTQLHLKAVRLRQPDPGLWLKRLPQASWERRALSSLDTLARPGDIAPDPQQPLAYWLPPALATPLAAHGLHTANDALAAYRRLGGGWWRALPGLGRTGAHHIEKILGSLFPGEPAHQPPAPTLPRETAPVPLERFLPPPHLDGGGRNRSPEDPLTPLSNDPDAIAAWLSLYAPGSATHRNYRREAERLLLWAALVQGKALSSLDATDMAAYRAFLHDPQPAADWAGPPRPRSHAGWRPFTGPLAARSIRHAETILHRLFDFLVQQRYWRHNPLGGLPRLRAPNGGPGTLAVHRAFSPAQWALISMGAERVVRETSGQARRKALRTQLTLELAYATGLRLSELARAAAGDLEAVERQGRQQAWLAVLGKGNKLRRVPLPPATLALITGLYRELTGQNLHRQPPGAPLIPDLRDRAKPVTPQAVHKALKGFFAGLAAKCGQDDPEAAARLRAASAHWLRHTHGTAAAARGIPLTAVRDNLGHASLATTSQYLHTESDARYAAYEHFTDAPETDNT